MPIHNFFGLEPVLGRIVGCQQTDAILCHHPRVFGIASIGVAIAAKYESLHLSGRARGCRGSANPTGSPGK